MPGSTRTVRRVQISKVADFDDQLWPINCAILILAGFVTGIVIATSDFHDPRLLYNGWIRLFGVGLTVGLLFWGVMWLQGKMLRRLQFCLLLSLMAHLGLAVYLHEEYLAATARWEARSRDQAIEQYEQITIPDYYWQQVEQPYAQQSYEEPIAIEAPRPTDPEAVQRQAEEPEIPAKTPPTAEPEAPQPQQPNPETVPRAVLSAPRRADAAAGAQISRQPWKDRPSPNQPIPEPEITLQPRQAAAVLDATTSPRPPSQSQVRVEQSQPSEEPASGRAQQVEVKLPQRAARREPLADAGTTPIPARQASPLAQLPPAQTVAAERVDQAQRTTSVPPTPTGTAAARRQADAPSVARPPRDAAPATPDTANAVAMATARQPRTEQIPPLGRPARTAPLRGSPELKPPTDLNGPQPEAAATQVASSQRPAQPIIRPPTTAVSTEADSPAAAVGEGAVGSGLPPMNNTAELPSALAPRRAAASERQPAGLEASPATPSSLARSDSGANLPSTAIPVEAQPATSPAAAGGTPASRLQAVSDAAVLRSAGRPPLGAGTAAAGTADFAVGSTDVVARTGQPRSGGIEQSSATTNAPLPRVARATGPAAPTAASGVAEASPTLPGVAATGPSGPPLPSLSAQDSAARQGGTVRPFAAVPAVGAGPPGSSGTPGPVGTAQSSRVTRHESIASAVAGGGTPRPGRTVGGDVAPSAVAEASQPATAAAGGGIATQAVPWQAQVSGPRRQVFGLPGQLQGQPMAGSLASLPDQGAPLPGAVARRAVASQQEGPGGRDIGSTGSSTMRRDDAGTDLPAAAIPIDNVAATGAGGVASAQGGLPSSLAAGPNATVRQAAAQLPIGPTAAAAGTAESALGSDKAVVMAGQTRAIGPDASASGAGAPGRPIGRTAAAGPAVATSGTLQAEPVGKAAPAGGPPDEARGLAQTTADTLQTGVARGSGQLPSVGPTGGPSAASPDEGPLATADLGPGSPSDAGTAADRRRMAQGDGTGNSLVGNLASGPQRSTDAPGLLAGGAEAVEQPRTVGPAAASPSEAVNLTGVVVGQPSRPEGGLPVRIPAAEGPGGLGYLPSPEVGIPSRRARPESEVVHTIFRRFVVERSGGQLAIDGRIGPGPAEAYQQRDPGRRAEVAQAWGGSEGTEKAVEMGLDYFARHQFPDGRWSLHELPQGIPSQDAALGQMEADSAATGLALLSYLGAGYTHLDGKYRGEVSRGIDWLVRHQKPDGDLFTGGTKYAWFYSHGIAAIALCEAYGMTRDPQLRAPARKAIEFIVNTQHPTRGGWRYEVDPQTGRSTETDTSVSGWMLMALKSAQMAGLDVPAETFGKVNAWLDTAEASAVGGYPAGQYVYNPHASDTPEQRAGRRPNLAMTSEAMLMRMYLGYDRNDSGLIAGARHLKENLPEVGTGAKPLRDCYYWYYATQAMFQMQDDYWTAWNDRLRPLATGSQVQSGELAGSWHPLHPVEDRWGRAGGRHYVTALHLLMLEVYYRHLPLFQELSK